MFEGRQEEDLSLLGSDSAPDFQPINAHKIIIARGKRAQLARAARTVVHTLYQSAFIQLILLIWLGVAQVVKFFIPFASMIMEAINLVASVINLVSKEKPWYLITLVILGSLASMVIMGLIDAFRFGSTVPFVVSAFAAGPAVFTAVLGMFAVLRFNKVIFVDLIPFIKNPSARLPLKVFSLVNGFVKGAGLAVLAGLMIPFFSALALNPYGAMVFAGAIVAVVGVLAVMKIVKTIVENVVWRRTIKEFTEKNKDPYELLGLVEDNKIILDQKLAHEESLRKVDQSRPVRMKAWLTNFSQKIKHFWYDSPLSTFFARTEKQKAKLESARENMNEEKNSRVSAFIKSCYLEAFEAANGDPAKQLLIKKAYDLFRKDRGMKLWEERPRIIKIDEESDSAPLVEHREPEDFARADGLMPQAYVAPVSAPAKANSTNNGVPNWSPSYVRLPDGIIDLKKNTFPKLEVRPLPVVPVVDKLEERVVRRTAAAAA